MVDDPFEHLDDIPEQEPVPGCRGKFVHSDNVTLACWDVDAKASLPEHAHPHEQVTTLVEGMFELTIGGETRLLRPRAVAVIPGDVKHSGRAITPCRIIDVFYPVREDYKSFEV